MSTPFEIRLQLEPESRLDVVDLRCEVPQVRELFAHYKKTLYCSGHTTAGFFEQSLGSRLGHRQGVDGFLRIFQELFPQQADYTYRAQNGERAENADSHLRFIGAGLKNCAS